MSSSDRNQGGMGRRISMKIAPVAALAFALAACTAQPLYAPYTATGTSVTKALERLTIDPVETRVAQQVRNKLIFDLGNRAAMEAPAYRMRLTVSSAESPLGVTPVESAPAYSVTVTTTYTVLPVGSDDIVLRATSRASASYDRVNQVFANVRAKRDAENRAAAAVANDIRIRLSAAAARGII